MKGDNHYRELEEKYRDVKENYEKLLKKHEGDNQNLNELRNVNEKLKMENVQKKKIVDARFDLIDCSIKNYKSSVRAPS
jgi:DNA repair exonuclease SbcCD ATPase subunit